jgi:hypothetical protein
VKLTMVRMPPNGSEQHTAASQTDTRKTRATQDKHTDARWCNLCAEAIRRKQK